MVLRKSVYQGNPAKRTLEISEKKPKKNIEDEDLRAS